MGVVFPFCMWVKVCVFSGYGKGKGRLRSAFSFFCCQRSTVVWKRLKMSAKNTKKDNTGCTFRFNHFSGLSFFSRSDRPDLRETALIPYSRYYRIFTCSVMSLGLTPLPSFHKRKRMLFTSCEWCSLFDASSMYVNALSLFLNKDYHFSRKKSSRNA